MRFLQPHETLTHHFINFVKARGFLATLFRGGRFTRENAPFDGRRFQPQIDQRFSHHYGR
jgi:hypothetical protein